MSCSASSTCPTFEYLSSNLLPRNRLRLTGIQFTHTPVELSRPRGSPFRIFWAFDALKELGRKSKPVASGKFQCALQQFSRGRLRHQPILASGTPPNKASRLTPCTLARGACHHEACVIGSDRSSFRKSQAILEREERALPGRRTASAVASAAVVGDSWARSRSRCGTPPRRNPRAPYSLARRIRTEGSRCLEQVPRECRASLPARTVDQSNRNRLGIPRRRCRVAAAQLGPAQRRVVRNNRAGTVVLRRSTR